MTLDVIKWTEQLVEAEARHRPVDPITATEPGLTAEDGYRIQQAVVAARTDAGERIVGARLGLARRAEQATMGVDQPVYGVLTSAMAIDLDVPVSCSGLIHPGVAPAIVFILAQDVSGPGVNSHDIVDATRWLTAGLEVIDSRYGDVRPSPADLIADNIGAARFVLGGVGRAPRDIPDLSLLGCNLDTAGRIVATAAGAAVLGHPAAAVARLANWLGSRGATLRAGDVVLSGGLTPPVPIRPGGYVSATFAHLGVVTLRGA